MSDSELDRQRRALGLGTVIVLAGTLAVWALVQKAPVDYTGDQISDFAVVRNIGFGSSGPVTWWIQNTVTSAFSSQNWGIQNDLPLSGDFDGDGLADIAIWRLGTGGTAGFWIIPSSTHVSYFAPFGQTGDNPSVVGDYDGDGKTDLAVYRGGTTTGAPSYWYYKRSIDGVVVLNQWGQQGDFVAPGDYDGDGKYDFAIQRNAGGGNAIFWLNQTTAGVQSVLFGTLSDLVVPGDYDGDGKTDIAVLRTSSTTFVWFVRRSSDGVITNQNWGAGFTTDTAAQGDYDGDGKTDITVFRNNGTFWVSKSTGGTLVRNWGTSGDYPVAGFNVH